MSPGALGQLLVLVALLVATVPALGRYLALVYGGGAAPGDRVFLPVERVIYRLCRVEPASEQRWTSYARSLLAFSVASALLLYGLLRLQGGLPLNPTGVDGVGPALSFNTAVSFMTNTNWQAYGGESTLSHLAQMSGLTVQNFVSAAAGMAVAVGVIRGLVRRGSPTLGNFWVDLTRSVVRVLVPLAFLMAVVLVSQGVVQNFDGVRPAVTVEGGTQEIPGGPTAGQVAIKQLGSNGGGFFNTNATHPFENPTPLTNLVETWAILAIPFAFPLAYGRLAGDKRQGRMLFTVMAGFWIAAALIGMLAETAGNPAVRPLQVDQSVGSDHPGGWLEGKEARIGSAGCGLWAGSTTGTSNGSVNCMHDSMTAAGGGIALLNIMLGEISPGGVGVGLMGLLVYALLAVFIAGLMVGRTPEYLGKKIDAAEIKLVMLFLLAAPCALLGFAAVSVVVPSFAESIQDPGPHGLSEVLYAFGSGANNNGSAFAGLAADTTWYETSIGVAMLVGRFFLIIPALAIAGSMGRKRALPVGPGTFPTHTPLFAGLVSGVVLIVAGLTFFPALALGPLAEALSP